MAPPPVAHDLGEGYTARPRSLRWTRSCRGSLGKPGGETYRRVSSGPGLTRPGFRRSQVRPPSRQVRVIRQGPFNAFLQVHRRRSGFSRDRKRQPRKQKKQRKQKKRSFHQRHDLSPDLTLFAHDFNLSMMKMELRNVKDGKDLPASPGGRPIGAFPQDFLSTPPAAGRTGRAFPGGPF